MKIHIICPFYRVFLLPTLIDYLEPMGIEWYPMICKKEKDVVFGKSWIHPIIVPDLLPTDQCYRKINDFITTQQIINDDYYGFMCDDDMYEPGFFDVIRQQTAKILMYSNYRGDTTPVISGAEGHPTNPLHIQNLDDVRVCNIGLNMYILKGEILKQTIFSNNHKWGDGYYAENLKSRFPNDIQILPNLFEPGRFTTKEKFLKPTWELPKIIGER